MSASLVGSEMCIRDREPASSRFRDLRTPSRPAFVGRFGISTKNAATVSYTHLTLPTICSV
eukprot:9858433-Alexandrium_andersonii.AAC.1